VTFPHTGTRRGTYPLRVPDYAPADLNCLLCGEPVEPPLVDPALIVQHGDDHDSLTTNAFLVHDRCARDAAHPAVADRVRERLDRAG
jgi:hypothetical protein